jgi:hypothetical protein
MAYVVAFGDRVRRRVGGNGGGLPAGILPFKCRRQLLGAGVPW